VLKMIKMMRHGLYGLSLRCESTDTVMMIIVFFVEKFISLVAIIYVTIRIIIAF